MTRFSLSSIWALGLLLPSPQEVAPPDLGQERPLRNDLVLPIDTRAQAEIERGDRAWSEGRAALAFDAWQSALEVSSTGQSVAPLSSDTNQPRPFSDPEGSHERRTEGVAYAVLRRLSSLTREESAAWRGRVAPLAEAATRRAGIDRARLMRLERNFPFTEGALRAALRLADLSLERGLLGSASAWLTRARRHVAALDPSTTLARRGREAVALRQDSLRPAPASDPGLWKAAKGLRAVAFTPLSGRPRAQRSSLRSDLGRRVETGAVILADGSLVVQAAMMLARVDREGTVQRFPLASLDALSFEMQPYASPASGGWPLLPVTDGRSLWMVVGREGPRTAGALACIDFDEGGLPFSRWVLGEEGLIRRGPGNTRIPRDVIVGPGRWSWQPGPVLDQDTLFVQAREMPEEEGQARSERLWLCAFEAATGLLRWKRDLGRPADLAQESLGRFGGSSLAASPGMPLALHEGRVFVGTNNGQGVLLDAIDGRIVWSFKNRRRSAEQRGWTGSRRPGVHRRGEGTPWVSWAPFDSDFMYALRLAPDLGQGILAARPWAQSEAIDVISADEQGAVLLGRSGARRVVLEKPPGEGLRHALYLGRAESFSGAGLASAKRVLLASDRALYLFDRTRELLLLDTVAFEGGQGGGGGGLWAHGNRVWVVGEDAVWTFEAF